MLRLLQVLGHKPHNATYVASEAMKQGMAVSIDHANGEVDKATGLGYYLVQSVPKYEGLNAVVPPVDDAFESIAANDRVIVIPTAVGERYATDQVTPTGLTKGDPLDVSAGLFQEATSGDSYCWIYGGTYADTTGTMYIVERVPNATV